MAAGQGLNVHGITQAVYDGIITHYGASDLALPDRRVVVPGDIRTVAWDCPALLVAFSRVGWGGGPGTNSATALPTGRGVSLGLRHVVITAQVVREVGDDGPSAGDALDVTEAGLLLARDAGMLSQALVELAGPGGAFRRAGSALAGEVIPVGPGGGYAAVEGALTVTAGDVI